MVKSIVLQFESLIFDFEQDGEADNIRLLAFFEVLEQMVECIRSLHRGCDVALAQIMKDFLISDLFRELRCNVLNLARHLVKRLVIDFGKDLVGNAIDPLRLVLDIQQFHDHLFDFIHLLLLIATFSLVLLALDAD